MGDLGDLTDGLHYRHYPVIEDIQHQIDQLRLHLELTTSDLRQQIQVLEKKIANINTPYL